MLNDMFDRFIRRYPLPRGRATELWDPEPLLVTDGYPVLARQVAGLPLCGGLIRIVGADEGRSASEFIREGFPGFAARAVPFAADWLGRVVAIDQARSSALLLVEPGSGEAFEIDQSFIDFFNVAVVDDPETFLAADLYKAWQSIGGAPPAVRQCVGFKVPLFLGGAGSPENMELTDLQVYWSFAAQLRSRTRTVEPGTQISRVDRQLG